MCSGIYGCELVFLVGWGLGSCIRTSDSMGALALGERG